MIIPFRRIVVGLFSWGIIVIEVCWDYKALHIILWTIQWKDENLVICITKH